MTTLCSLLRSLLVATLAGVFSAFALAQQPQEKPVVRIAIAQDGPSETADELLTLFREEAALLLQEDLTPQFPEDKQLRADWTAAGVKSVIDRLMADPEVDVVVAAGILVSNEVGRRGPLPKPTFAAVVFNPELQGIPIERRGREATEDRVEPYNVSGVPNLSYTLFGTDYNREVEMFRDIFPFDHVAALFMKPLEDAVPDLDEKVRAGVAEQTKLRISEVAVGTSVDDALAAIPADAEAVYIAPLSHLSKADFDRLVQGLIERKLPSWSGSGSEEVQRGVLVTLWPQQENLRRARRIALNMLLALTGKEKPEDLSVDFERSESLTINMATARTIGVSPTFQVMIEADLLNEERSDVVRTIALSDVILEASKVNLDLAIADRTVTAGQRLVREAKANLLPQLDLTGGWRAIDRDRADISLGGTNPQYSAFGTGRATQLIYGEKVRANYDVERHLQNVRQEDRAEVRLDVIQEAARSYIDVLRAKTVERIQKDNLNLTRSNLELARSRVEIGQAGREEVFRWDSQIATNRQDVVSSGASRNEAETAVNRVLNRPISERFGTVEAGLDDAELITSFDQIRPFIESPAAFEMFRRLMVEEAFEASPELRQVDNAILAQQRTLTATKRQFYIPDMVLGAEITPFSRAGAGSGRDQLSFLRNINNTNWVVFGEASIPLYAGGGRTAERNRAMIELDRFTVEREATRQRIEQRIRSILHQTNASFINIDLARDAAIAAQRNLELVTDQYAEGIVDILRLLDAQNQALVADLAAANAVFNYLFDLMDTQRAVGRFDYYRSPEDRQQFLNRLGEYFQKAGVKVRRR